jgi:hypothetical protein
MSLIHNERTKLSANAFNTAATACFTVGVLAPLAAVLYKIGSGPIPPASIAFGALIWLFVAAFLHYCARWILGGLRQ